MAQPSHPGRRPRVRVPGIAIAALALIVIAVGGLAPALTTYLDQRQQLADTAAHIAAQKAELHRLDDAVARWNDPAYVRAQAASRLFYVVPGTTAYRVIGGAEAAETTPPAKAEPAPADWAGTLLQSYVAAGTTTSTPGGARTRRMSAAPDPADLEAVSAQLGRPARDVVAIAARTVDGAPAVVSTAPRLADGTPFPTFYYLTHPLLVAAISRLEAEGRMREWTDLLAADAGVAGAYARAHDAYLADRAAAGEVAEIAGVSAGGMPTRVKCLHALAGHALAAGPGVNPIGDLALEAAARAEPPVAGLLAPWLARAERIQRIPADDSGAGERPRVG